MDSFPEGFNSNSNLDNCREEYYLNNLRANIYKHIITNGKKGKFSFYNITKEDKEFPNNINKVIEELTNLGFKHKLLFGDDSLLIYVNDKDASIWLNETLCNDIL